ncbi:MAG: CBS domain-containing protein [Planctomycetota bacterium]
MDFELSLQSETVRAAYPDEPLAATPDTAIADVMRLLRAQKTGAVLVCEGDRLVGIFTERDAMRLMADSSDLSQPVSTAMTSNTMNVSPGTTVGEAIELMASGGYRHLPIVDGAGTPVGVVQAPGIVHYLVDHFPETIYNLPPHTAGPPTEREGA